MSQGGAISSTGGGTLANTYITDNGSATPINAEINMRGGNLISSTGVNNFVSYDVATTVVASIVTDSGTSTAALNAVTLSGATGVSTSAVDDVITISGSDAIPLSFSTDSGTATPASNALTIAGGTGISTTGAGSTVTVNLDTPVAVADGGSGRASATAYAVVCGGTTATGAHQSIASVGSSGQVLTSNGAGALPTFQTVSADYVYLNTATASSSATISFTGLTSTYNSFKIILSNISPQTDNVYFYMRTSTDGGSSYDSGASDYAWSGESVEWLTTANRRGSGDDADAQMVIGVANATAQYWGNAANETGSFEITIYNPLDTANYTQFSWIGCYYDPAGVGRSIHGAGARKSAADVDAVQFAFNSGNIVSGEFRLYGIVNS